MRLRDGQITPRELSFATHYARTGDTRYAAEKAGYAPGSVNSAGYRALNRAPVRQLIAGLRERRAERAAEIAFDTLEEIAQKHDAALMPRVSAADKLAKAAGLYQPHADQDDQAKELHELPIDVLRARVARWIAEDLEPIEDAPDLAAIHPCLG